MRFAIKALLGGGATGCTLRRVAIRMADPLRERVGDLIALSGAEHQAVAAWIQSTRGFRQPGRQSLARRTH